MQYGAQTNVFADQVSQKLDISVYVMEPKLVASVTDVHINQTLNITPELELANVK